LKHIAKYASVKRFACVRFLKTDFDLYSKKKEKREIILSFEENNMKQGDFVGVSQLKKEEKSNSG